jgi:ATP/maltotriose-dependent transcriptional regulator MalT/DNA-binding SARP family transcriptional activator
VAESKQRSIAFAKTTRPVVSSAVPRERLFARLDGAPGRSVAWISGPPGSGKTTLAASYVEARRMRSLWYQVDPDDADVATFFHYLGHAARKLDGGRVRDFPAFASPEGAELAAFARKFFRHLFSRAKGPFALVLDNLHAVPAESALHAVVEAAIGQIPRQCCVIVTSRSDPPVGFARFRVTGEMVCLNGESLRIDRDELARIAQLRGQSLAPEAVTQLHERTQGWAAGLVLMLEHAKLAGRFAEVPGDAPPQAVFDYLAGEIFERFEAGTRRFLLRVACLPRMTAEVAQALSGEEKAGRLLVNLALNNYFVSEAQADDGRIYQLHPLLRDFLRRRAAQDLPEALGAGHLGRAAGLLRAAGQIEDAVSLLVECRDWEGIARIAVSEAAVMLSQGRTATLGEWLELLPAGVLEADPALLLALGECRSRSAPREARRRFEQALAGFLRDGKSVGAVRSCRGLIDAIIFEFDDLAPLDHWCAVLAGLLKERAARGLDDAAGAARGPDDADRAAAGAMVRAMLLRDAGSAALADWIERARAPLARAASALLRGDLAAAGASIEGMQTGARGLAPRLALAAGLASALHHLLDGAHARALEKARACLAQAEAEGVHGYDGWLRAAAAAAALGAGDRDMARGEVQRLDAGDAPQRRGDRAILHYLRGWLASLDGDADGALREARSAVALAAETGLPWLECLARGALARCNAAARDRRGSEAQLRAAEALADAQRSGWLRFCVCLAAAESALALGDESAALGPLRRAFALGREHGFRHAPWWRPREMAELCALALQQDVEPEYARGLIRERRLVPRTPPLRVPGWPWPFRIATFGRFELLLGDAAVEISGKGPGRPMELLKVLVALGGQNVRADQLGDALWPHVDADYAHKSFTATLHRLRRLFGEEDALLLRDGRLSLDPGTVWADVWTMERVIAHFDEALRGPGSGVPTPSLHALANEALALYRGPFLPDESEQPSYLAYREQSRARLLRCLTRVARSWEDSGQAESAADCYLRFIDADPLYEAPYRNLMLSYQRCGNLVEARATYERLRSVLGMKLKVMPSAETQAVYAALALPAQK